MKRISILFAAMAVSTISAFSQDAGLVSYMNDAMNWCSNDYYGSARTLGMGNAVTAVGGDLGTVAINPAGSAVAGYSQVALTPGLSFSIVNTAGIPSSDGNTYLSYNAKNTATKFTVPLAGVVFNFDLGNVSGLKSWTMGFIASGTNCYNRSIHAAGQNAAGTSTFAGCLAAIATDEGYGNFSELSDLGWRTDMFGINSAVPGGYAGITENGLTDGSASLGGAIDQNYTADIKGSKMDYLFNFGFNCSDIVYFGFNLGITNLSYRYSYILFEDAVDSDFFQTGFSRLSHSYSYKASGSGVYFKAGVLCTPIAGLRIGAAIQTPTQLNLGENYSHTLNNSYMSSTLSATSEPGSWRFKVVSPWRFNVGLAYTLGQFGVISADYEMVDFSTMKFREYYSGDLAFCNDITHVIQGSRGTGKCMGISHNARAGIEIKPTPEFAIRAGYNFTMSPEAEMQYGTKVSTGSAIHSGTFGLGYDSPGSFFCDLAAKLSFQPDGEILVYDPYTNRMAKESSAYREIGAPLVSYKSKLLNVALTVGWRF